MSGQWAVNGQHGFHTKYIRLVAFLFIMCLPAGLVWQIMSPAPSPSPPSPHSNSDWSTRSPLAQPNQDADLAALRVHGRWQAVRASLGLPPLPHDATEPASAVTDRFDKRHATRFDLGNKRWAKEAGALQQPLLRFAADARPSHSAGHPDTPRYADKSTGRHSPDSSHV